MFASSSQRIHLAPAVRGRHQPQGGARLLWVGFLVYLLLGVFFEDALTQFAFFDVGTEGNPTSWFRFVSFLTGSFHFATSKGDQQIV